MMAKLTMVSQKSAIAEAIRYALTRWDGLCRFIEDQGNRPSQAPQISFLRFMIPGLGSGPG